MIMTDSPVSEILERQRAFYRTGTTRDVAYRKRQLNALFDIWFRYAPYKHSYAITKWLL